MYFGYRVNVIVNSCVCFSESECVGKSTLTSNPDPDPNLSIELIHVRVRHLSRRSSSLFRRLNSYPPFIPSTWRVLIFVTPSGVVPLFLIPHPSSSSSSAWSHSSRSCNSFTSTFFFFFFLHLDSYVRLYHTHHGLTMSL